MALLFGLLGFIKTEGAEKYRSCRKYDVLQFRVIYQSVANRLCVIAVSYTHLVILGDRFYSSYIATDYGDIDIDMVLKDDNGKPVKNCEIYFVHRDYIDTYNPVSYTHLDGYKRQA